VKRLLEEKRKADIEAAAGAARAARKKLGGESQELLAKGGFMVSREVDGKDQLGVILVEEKPNRSGEQTLYIVDLRGDDLGLKRGQSSPVKGGRATAFPAWFQGVLKTEGKVEKGYVATSKTDKHKKNSRRR